MSYGKFAWLVKPQAAAHIAPSKHPAGGDG